MVALDEADHHAVLIGRREVNGAALDRVARLEVLRPRMSMRRARGQVRVVQHLLGRHFHGERSDT